MSASQQKKRRQNTSEQPVEPQASRRKSRAPWIAAIAGVAVLILLAAFFAVFNSGILQRNVTAATVGGHKITPVMYNYFLQNTIQQTFGSQVDLDPSIMAEPVNEAIAQTYAVCDAAQAAGHTLTDEEALSLENQLLMEEYNASLYSYTLDSYLAQVYGVGANEETFREYLELIYMASSYQLAYSDSLTYTQEDIDAYYAENTDSLDTVSYRSYACRVETGETEEDGSAVVDSEASKALAEEMAATTEGDPAAFAEFARNDYAEKNDLQEGDTNRYEDEDTTLLSDISVDALAENTREWLTDDARQLGDTTCIENSDGSWSAIMFVDNWTKYDQNTVNIRSLLVLPGGTEEADMEEARERAQGLLDDFLAGDATEEAFEEMAHENSDAANGADGGLSENLYPGQMAESYPGEDLSALDAWCFDEAHEAGDTALVETSVGCFVVYYVSEGQNWQDLRTETAMRSADTTDWLAELADAMPVTTNSFGLWLVSKS